MFITYSFKYYDRIDDRYKELFYRETESEHLNKKLYKQLLGKMKDYLASTNTKSKILIHFYNGYSYLGKITIFVNRENKIRISRIGRMTHKKGFVYDWEVYK